MTERPGCRRPEPPGSGGRRGRRRERSSEWTGSGGRPCRGGKLGSRPRSPSPWRRVTRPETTMHSFRLPLALLALIPALPLRGQSLCHAVNDDDLYDTSIALGFPVAQAAFKGVAAGNMSVVAAEVFTGESSG